MTESNIRHNKSTHRWKRNWVWVETTTGHSCIDVDSIIGISESTDSFGGLCYDLHLSSGTIFTIQERSLSRITEELPEWEVSQ